MANHQANTTADTVITDDELALMVDIAQNAPIKMTPRKQERLEQLLTRHLIEPRTGGGELGSGPYALTKEGEKKLADLGVGANES